VPIDRKTYGDTIKFVKVQKGLYMSKKRLLISWIGHADLRAMTTSLPKADQKRIFKELKLSLNNAGSDGPIKTLLKHETFDEIHLIDNYPKGITKRFKTWLGGNIKLHKVALSNPTDYSEVFSIVDQILKKVVSSSNELSFHLSPGTPTMAAIWVLLGKSKFPATFYQTHDGKAWKTEIPFDLVLDYVPEVLKNPDRHLQHLSAQIPQEIKGFEDISGSSQTIRIAAGRAKRAAIRDVSVLLAGESGTGKELFAQAIHNSSSRRDKPFKAINCAAIPSQLLESELFGHKKGTFTGADKDKDGLFKAADGGTIFLDEIGECPTELQAKLLRLLQPPIDKGLCYRAFTPIGSSKEEYSNARIIAATNKDLVKEIQLNMFREDLYYRLAVISIKLPPLRDRKDDIVQLADVFLHNINAEFKRQEPGYTHKVFSDSTKIFMKNYLWPGNIRQLHNAIVQAAVMSETEIIEKTDIQEALVESVSTIENKEEDFHIPEDGFNLEEHLNSLRIKYLEQAMKRCTGVKTKAARLLGMRNYQTLDAQIKKLKVKW